MDKASCIFEIITQTLENSHNRLSVSELCKTAGVSAVGIIPG